jgi:hypothetical protein
MPNPTLTALARELADLCPMKDVFPGCRCKECRRAFAATALANLLTYEPAAALASPPVEAAQGEPDLVAIEEAMDWGLSVLNDVPCLCGGKHACCDRCRTRDLLCNQLVHVRTLLAAPEARR